MYTIHEWCPSIFSSEASVCDVWSELCVVSSDALLGLSVFKLQVDRWAMARRWSELGKVKRLWNWGGLIDCENQGPWEVASLLRVFWILLFWLQIILYFNVHASIKWIYKKLNVRYPKTFSEKKNSENTCYNFLKMILGFLYSLDLFQTYTNVPIIYLKHYCKGICQNFNIDLPFKIIKN